MMNYLQRMASYLRGSAQGTAVIPQMEPLDEWQVRNSAGGYSYPVDQWKRLERFLILGSERGSYYATERTLTKENVDAVLDCIKTDGIRVVKTVVEISDAGRAPKNGPALFVLALCAAAEDVRTRQVALATLPEVARTGTHLFEFLRYVQEMRGWGRALRTAVAEWYVAKPAEQLAMQLVKYRQRQGWTHGDALRLSHAKSAALNPALRFAVKGDVPREGWDLVQAFSKAQKAGNGTRELVRLIFEHNLTWEMLPTDALIKPEIWEALLPKMPMTAMLRNLANMTRVGLLAPMSDAVVIVCDRLRDAAQLKKARIHPIQVLLALSTYASGRGFRGKGSWTPVQQVVDALNEAFYLAFASVEPTGKRWYIGLDVSGSMACGAVASTPLTPREAASATSLVIARTEPRYWGMGATVGSVIATKGAIIPAAVGVDLGCGMVAVETNLTAEDLPDNLGEIRSAIEQAVPHGRTDNGGPSDRGAWHDLPETNAAVWNQLKSGYEQMTAKHPKLDRGNHVNHLCTLGTGNHFIEVCLDENN